MPKQRMVGTQMPTKIASKTCPFRKTILEKIRERKAATNSSLSVRVNLVNIWVVVRG
jgi:hypothetical protein